MLFILYGAASEVGYKSKVYLESKGLEIIDKYAYCEQTPSVKSHFGEREYISKEDFEEKTDSLFRYEFANVVIGFDWSQITDAVYSDGTSKKKNKVLTLATSNVEILRKIKNVYPNDVKIIYCHMDALCLENMLANLSNLTPEEYGVRMATGKAIKDSYSANADVFDYTVIYGGENTAFDYTSLYKQYDGILKILESSQEQITYEKYDIFISYSAEQKSVADSLIETLQSSGMKVFTPDNIIFEGDFESQIKAAMLNSKIYVPIVSNKALESAFFTSELKLAINSGTVIYPITFQYDNLNWEVYNSIIGLANLQPFFVDLSNYTQSIKYVTDWFHEMFTIEESLLELSSKVDDYASAGVWDKAVVMQERYIYTLEKYISIWRKKDINMLISAQIKWADMLIKMHNFEKAYKILEEIFSTISNESLLRFENDLSLLKEVINVKNGDSKPTITEEYNGQTPLEDKIASYAKATIELFEALFESGFAPGYSETLILAYDRILSYCKSVNLGNEIPAICIDKIAELKTFKQPVVSSTSGENTLHSLKVYLGQALPNTGHYDVFISHKSADDAIATKVYDYLKQTGKVAFCDHFTLGELHDSEYDKRIVEALENTKHLVVVASDPEYLKDQWVYSEWHRFYNDKRLKRRNGNLILILSDDLVERFGELPSDLRDGIQYIKTSEFRNRIDDYLW